MGKDWDKLDWQAGGGFSKPGIGDRQTAWPSFASGTSNPTCVLCGGRLRGAKRCSCPDPEWKVKGESTGVSAREHGASTVARQMRAQQDWHKAWLAEAYRVLAPGGLIKAFGGSRTFHRLAAAMGSVGFVEVEVEAWGYASGFPKSHNIAIAVDKQAGMMGHRGKRIVVAGYEHGHQEVGRAMPKHEPVSPEALLWDGWGTALKPAWEPVVVGRKPVL